MTLEQFIARRDKRRCDFRHPVATAITICCPCSNCGETEGDAFRLDGDRWCEACWKRQRNEHLGLIPHGHTGGTDRCNKGDEMSPWQESAYGQLEG